MKLRRLVFVALVSGLAFASAPAWALSSGDLIKQGVGLLRDGKNQEALDLFTKAQRLDPNGPRPHYYIASALERLGEPDSAKTEYETALRINPKYVEALTGIGKLFRKQGQKEPGTARLEEAVKYGPKDAPALYALGQAYLEDKRWDDAERVFRKGTLLKQGRALFLGGTALALEGKGDLKQAEEIFIRARETDPNNLRVRLDLGGFYTRKKIPVLAAPEYGRATELDPKNPEVHYLYGKALIGMNEFNAGLAAFIRATEQDSAYAPAYLESGRLFYRAKRHKEAADNFRTYTGLKPDDPEGYVELGRALANSPDPNDRQEAKVVLSTANEKMPDVPDVLGALCRLYAAEGADGRENALLFCDKYASVADSLTAEDHLRVGEIYVAADDSSKAVTHLMAAVAQDSTTAKNAYFQLGFLFFSRRDYPAATPYFEQTLKADSTFLPALLNLGLCRLQMQQKSEAIEVLRKALVIRPNDARTMVWIGQTLLSMEPDSLPIALETYQAAVAADSSSADALRGAGLALLLMDRCVDGNQYLARATGIDPEHVQGHIWLAQGLNKCRDVGGAKVEFNKAIELDPNNREAADGLRRIREWEEKQRARQSAGTP